MDEKGDADAGISRWQFFRSLVKGALKRAWKGSHVIHTIIFLLATAGAAFLAVRLEETEMVPWIILGALVLLFHYGLFAHAYDEFCKERSESLRLRAQVNDLKKSHADETASLHKAIEQARNSDPRKVAIRRQIEKYVEECDSLPIDPSAKALHELYVLEFSALRYLQRVWQEYSDFEIPGLPIRTGPQPMPDARELGSYSPRRAARIAKLKEMLAML
jgi:hypothetical protein